LHDRLVINKNENEGGKNATPPPFMSVEVINPGGEGGEKEMAALASFEF